MISVPEYVARGSRFVLELQGQVIESIYRVRPFDDDGRASCIGIGSLILFHSSGSLLFAVDEGYRNLFLYQAEGTGSFEKERKVLEPDADCPLAALVGARVETVGGLRRPREFDNDCVFCGVSIHTAAGVAHIGAYLTEMDDAGVCLLSTAQLDRSVEAFELVGGS